MQEESKNWVTEENLEEKIAYCLENETNYNFAITPSGERIYSTTPPGCVDSEENTPGPAAYYPKGLPSNLEKQEVDGYWKNKLKAVQYLVHVHNKEECKTNFTGATYPTE